MIVHRDIKPSNIILRAQPPGGTSRGARCFALIDFGAVQQKIIASCASSTIVGTSGYVPIEQLMGHAQPASDLYALGASAIFLLSHRNPAEMTSPGGLAVDFRPFVQVSEPFADFLAHLTSPYVEERPHPLPRRYARLRTRPACQPPRARSCIRESKMLRPALQRSFLTGLTRKKSSSSSTLRHTRGLRILLSGPRSTSRRTCARATSACKDRATGCSPECPSPGRSSRTAGTARS